MVNQNQRFRCLQVSLGRLIAGLTPPEVIATRRREDLAKLEEKVRFIEFYRCHGIQVGRQLRKWYGITINLINIKKRNLPKDIMFDLSSA